MLSQKDSWNDKAVACELKKMVYGQSIEGRIIFCLRGVCLKPETMMERPGDIKTEGPSPGMLFLGWLWSQKSIMQVMWLLQCQSWNTESAVLFMSVRCVCLSAWFKVIFYRGNHTAKKRSLQHSHPGAGNNEVSHLWNNRSFFFQSLSIHCL